MRISTDIEAIKQRCKATMRGISLGRLKISIKSSRVDCDSSCILSPSVTSASASLMLKKQSASSTTDGTDTLASESEFTSKTRILSGSWLKEAKRVSLLPHSDGGRSPESDDKISMMLHNMEPKSFNLLIAFKFKHAAALL